MTACPKIDRARRRGVPARALAAAAALVTACTLSFAARAADVKVLTATAFRPVLAAMAPGFEKRTGHRIVVVNDAAAGVAKRIREGEDFDLAILPPALLETLGKEGTVSDGSITPLAAQGSGPSTTVYAGAVATSAVDSNAALSLLVLLASEQTQAVLKDAGLRAP